MAAPTSSKKPKKKPKSPIQTLKNSPAPSSTSKAGTQTPAFPLAAFFWPARKYTSQWLILPLVFMIVGLYRWCVGMWGYSGFQKPPMHGDYEAQRHWMEIMTQLPVSQWYFYDLEYWGLDYPPLTAYHSWLLGKIGAIFDPSWFALDSSRGMETQLLKVYMRATVVVSEYITYIPAVTILNRKLAQLRGVNKWESSIALVAILMQPATILIDHAHFQYNTVMLGLVLASMSSILSDRYIWASGFFVAALCFKQMALYYAPPIFAYLIGSCLLPNIQISRFLSISIATIISFAIIFAPLLLGSLYDHYHGISPPLSTQDREFNSLSSTILPYIDPKSILYTLLLQLTQSIHRIFPFARGLFEDKVANVWCAIHTIHKLHTYPIPLLQRISLFATIIAILPACMTISLFPRKVLLPWAFASSAWGFFLFSFQVHEKSVLLPLLPMTILLSGDGGLGIEMRAWVGWANMLGVWTLFPLLKRDELRTPYYVLTLLWAYLLGLPPTSLDLYFSKGAKKHGVRTSTTILHLGFYALMIAWHIAEAFIAPPTNKPDLWVVLNVLIGAGGFGICFLWCTSQLILRSGVMEDWLSFQAKMQKVNGKPKEENRKSPSPESTLQSRKGTRATAPREAKKSGSERGKGTRKS
ncbi:Glucosyltransferase-like protein [Lecanora helva]